MINHRLKLITTEDGSHSLYRSDINESYHSLRGARGESMHVFIVNGLEYLFKTYQINTISILEIGLGTGLNALLTSEYIRNKDLSVNYTALEPYPISSDVYEQLNYGINDGGGQILTKIHSSDWERNISLQPNMNFRKERTTLEEYMSNSQFHLIFFDAFAPGKQPEVWSIENLQKCYDVLLPSGVLTTYCAQGQFKRNLLGIGYEVETLQGAMGKKEMVRAIKRS